MAKRSNKPAKEGLPKSGEPFSIIAAGLTITGKVESEGMVHIEGSVDGDVYCRHLTVGDGGQVSGNVSARTVEVLGETKGTIQAKKVIIASSAKVFGEVIHETLVIESGARLNGYYRCADRVDPSGTVDIRQRIGSADGKGAASLRRVMPPRREPNDRPVSASVVAKSESKSLH